MLVLWLARADRRDSIISHWPSFKVFVNSLLDTVLSEDALLERDLLTTKAGCLGLGMLALSLASMDSTFDIVG